MHPDLSALLAEWPKTQVVILPSRKGGSYRSKSFGNFMAKNIEQAGLAERCVAHGLRKAAARRLAEAGCSTKEIASITGHRSLKEIERYTKAAEQKKLATAAIDRLKKQTANQFPEPLPRFGKLAGKGQ